MKKILLTIGMAATVLAAGCTTEQKPAPPEAFGPQSYRGLTLGMARQAALDSGKLATAATSTMKGCEDFPYTGGPAPDPARMEAEKAAELKSAELNRKADEIGRDRKPLPANATLDQITASAEESAAAAKVYAESAEAIATVAEKNEARKKAFLASGGVSVSLSGQVRAIAAPPGVKTPEGIGAGSTADEVKAAYRDRGLTQAENGDIEIPIDKAADTVYLFTMTPDNKVAGVEMFRRGAC